MQATYADTREAAERFGDVDYYRGNYSWQCPECPARYSDAWGGRDTTIRRRQHIMIAHAPKG
jgi:hypothetical protein